MATFRTQLTDIKNYVAEAWLDGISDEQIIKEINGEHSYTFTIPLDHIYYPYLTERKYIRLHDIDKDFISTTISTGTGTKTVVVASNSGFKIGDYVIINETTENNWAAELNGAITAGAAKTVTFQNDVGTLFPASGNRYIKIWDDRDAEKTVATNVFRRQPNSEQFEASSITATTFVSDVAYDYNDGAYVFQPGRSFATKITNINGTTISLSRKDFTVQASSRVEKINYTTFRIVEITEHRSDTKPFATVRCNHLTYDLNDTVYFKNSRLMFAAGTNTLATAFIDLIDIDAFMDNVLLRQVDSSGDPIKTTSFMKGDLLRFIHSKGQVTTDGTAVVVTDDESGLELNSIHVASSSTMSIVGESSTFTIASQDTANFDSITLTATVSNTATVDYHIISKGIYTGDDLIGTCSVTNDSKVISSINITVTDGTVSHGAVFGVEGDTKSYLVDYVATTGADLVLTEAIERATGSTLNFILKTDKRELKINAGIKLLGALRKMVEVFSDDRQHINFKVNPDRSIDVIQTPIPDDRDPTSDLVVRYQDQMVKNLTSIERLFDITDFGNRIIPQGASSGWINTFSGVSSSVLGNPVGLQKSGVSNVAFLQDDAGRNFKTLGVIPGMVVTNSTQVATGTVSSIQDQVATNDRLNFAGGMSSGDWDSGNSFVIDLGHTRNQTKITTGDLKKFRFGDPIRVFQDKFTFTETESTQITISKGLSGDATSGSTTTMVDSTPTINFVTEGVTAGMLITNTKSGKANAFARITSISTTTNTNDTINFTGALSGSQSFAVDDTYVITLVEQYSFMDDGSVFTDESADADSETSADVNLLPVTPAVNDAFYFGASEVFGYITIKFSAIGGDTITNVWEYFDGTQFSTLTFNIQEITDFTHPSDSDGEFTNTFRIPTDWVTTTINGQSAFWVRFRVTAFTSGGATPVATQIFNREWKNNKYSGGLVLVTANEGKGQIRRVVTNTQNTLTVSRRWDILPKGATLIVARRIAKTFVRGFGYRKFTADEAGANFVTAFGLPTVDRSYRGGLLVVESGPGQSQFFTLEGNLTQDGGSGSAEDTAWSVDGTFNPIPDGAIIEVTALPQQVEEVRADTIFAAGQVDVILDLDPNSVNDLYDGGQIVVTSGTQEGNTKTVTTSTFQSGFTIRLSNTGWGVTPTNGDGIIVTRETDLHLSFADAIDFVPDAGDEVVLLMKESSVPLTVGKYATRRSTIVTATQTTVDVQSGDGGNFAANDIIYVGALQLNTTVSLIIGRGDQVIGKEYTIKSISTDELTLNESMSPTPQPGDHIEVIGFVDTTSIIKNDIVEVVFERSDLNDPKTLFDEANRYLQDITSIEPRYKVQFIDLYEVDRSKFAFDNYEVGDSIRIIDDRVTGNEGANLRVLREEFSPNLPPDKTNTLELGKQPLRQADDYISKLYQKQIDINRKIDLLRYEKNVPRCMWWDDSSLLCAKPDWPNTFCNTVDSGFNGRTRRDGSQIQKIDCQAYEPPDANRVGSETARVEGQLLTVSSVSNSTYNNTQRVAIDVPFALSDSSYCFIIEVSDDASITSQIDPTAVSCRIQVDTDGVIVPFVVVGEELGVGGYVQVKRDSGSTTYTVTIQVHATGCDI